jgi:hypothetical protein
MGLVEISRAIKTILQFIKREVLQPASLRLELPTQLVVTVLFVFGVCRFIRHRLHMNELHILVLHSVTSQESAFRRPKYIQSETHMVFDWSSGRFHLAAILLVLRKPFRQSARSSTFNSIIQVLRMSVLSQTAYSSSRHPPRAFKSVPLVKSLGAGFLASVAIHPYAASLSVGTSAIQLNYA